MNRFLGLIVLVAIVSVTSAQLVVDAGADTVYCSTNVVIGGDPSASGGIPPYTYTWTAQYEGFSGYVYHASEFLDDTTLANPELRYSPEELKHFMFYLKVEDAVGNVGFDSVDAVISMWVFVTADCIGWVAPGDPFLLFLGGYSQNFGGALGIHWLPETYLVDPFAGSTTAYPEEEFTWHTSYTDSAGCVGGQSCTAWLFSTGIEEEEPEFSLYPNPIRDRLTVQLPEYMLNSQVAMKWYSENGTLVRSDMLMNKETLLDLSALSEGFYIVSLFRDDQLISSRKVSR